MIGLLVWGIIGFILLKEAIQNAVVNVDERSKAMNEGKEYYYDIHGNCRRVDNGHKVLTYVPNIDDGSWDMCDIDNVTGEVLKNYSQIKRDKIAERIKQYDEEAMKRKLENIEKGYPFYWKMEYIPDEKNPKEGSFDIRFRRINDDLLLARSAVPQHVIADAKYELLLWVNPKLYDESEYRTPEEDVEYNQRRINKLVREKNEDREELIAYAKKIQAIGCDELK